MKLITTTNARKQISALVNNVAQHGDVYALGRHDTPEALLIKYPTAYNPRVSDITNINTYSESFSFLENEPDLYTIDDLRKRYV